VQMIEWLSQFRRQDDELGALTSELRVRVLNGSATGCLVESTRALEVGTVAALRVNILGHEYDDEVQVTRCQSIVGAGNIFHVAMQFLSTTPPYAGTFRHAIHRELGQFAGWLHAPRRADEQPQDSSRRRTAGATEE
jgi:hypothetical protein